MPAVVANWLAAQEPATVGEILWKSQEYAQED